MNTIKDNDKVLVNGLVLARVIALSRDGITAEVQYEDGSKFWYLLSVLEPYNPKGEAEEQTFKIGDKVLSPKGYRGKVVEIDDEKPVNLLVEFEHDGFQNWFSSDRMIFMGEDKPASNLVEEKAVEKPALKAGDDVVVWGEKVGIVKLDDQMAWVQRANGTKFSVPLSYMIALPGKTVKASSNPVETEKVDPELPTYKEMWDSRNGWRTEANKLRDQIDLLKDASKKTTKGKNHELVRRVFDLEAELLNMTKSRNSWMKGGSIHQQTIIHLQEELSAARGGNAVPFQQLQEENHQLRQKLNHIHSLSSLPQEVKLISDRDLAPMKNMEFRVSPGTSNPWPKDVPADRRVLCSVCGSVMTWDVPGLWNCKACKESIHQVPKTKEPVRLPFTIRPGAIIPLPVDVPIGCQAVCCVCGSRLTWVSNSGMWRCNECTVDAEVKRLESLKASIKTKPVTQSVTTVTKDYSANYKALILMKNGEAKKRAHYAINNAVNGHLVDMRNSVRGCREWARNNHKSFQKVFGEVLKGII